MTGKETGPVTDIEILKAVIIEVMKALPPAPFLCLPLSACLYAKLRDHHKVDAELVTGNLVFRGDLLFKQDFSIEGAKANQLRDWGGHAWVEVGGLICDLSFFRTLYSDEFDRPYKAKLIEAYGHGRGAIVGSPETLRREDGLQYQRIDSLSDPMATAIIKGIEHLPIWKGAK